MCGKKSQPDFRSAPVHGCMPQNRFTGRQGVDDYRTNQGGSLAKIPAHVYNGGSGHVPHASRDNLQPLATATQNSFVTAKQQLPPEGAHASSLPKRNPGHRLGINRSISSASSSSSSSCAPYTSSSASGTSSNLEDESYSANLSLYQLNHNPLGPNSKQNTVNNQDVAALSDDRLKNIEPKMVQFIMNEPVTWDDIAGLEHAKKTIKEIVVDIFTGLRGPPKGILLFGPPGTGKTLIGKCIASQSGATFFNISASSLTSKWIGEGEKMVRALFAVARCRSPSVIFVDEIDSLLTARTEGEMEATRRLKTEFLIQLDGAGTDDARLLLIGATNRPQELDEAARRRLVKRLYIPLPDAAARADIVRRLCASNKMASLVSDDYVTVGEWTAGTQIFPNSFVGYSGSDMHSLCREASLGPIRSIPDITSIQADQVACLNNK
ncbi:hypothetical protein DI09_15p350 [Mitosporidium daphniae]|uniref:AAA+ ATPase domain-containing protein n=1 Tax=Mitosporidium daphniae TaxID=1485682 RepID=A0A098VTW3_9MICR|nr:uncharacterized protein DI09_15p350 [Mitosporidium daphniae]KGG52568.1 hypothetical protein DI09_15p350 [Mitosporidium daphniae]|eukprot:XP_013238995.1 uncharacterized protein DI09_15p350 [Mitosporidium daphniae]